MIDLDKLESDNLAFFSHAKELGLMTYMSSIFPDLIGELRAARAVVEAASDVFKYEVFRFHEFESSYVDILRKALNAYESGL